MHPGHSQAEGVRFWHRADAQQGGHRGDVALFDQRQQIILSPGQRHAVPGNDQWSLGLAQHPGRLLKLVRQVIPGKLVTRQIDLSRILVIDLGRLGILGDVNQHRPRSACAGNVERLLDHRGQFPRIGDQVVMLGDRLCDPDDIHLLKGVGANDRGDHLPGDGHHRCRIHVGRGQSGDQVGRARTRGGDADANLARGTGIAISSVGRALLMAHKYMVDRILGQRVIQVDDCPSRDPEHGVHSLLDKTLPNSLRSGQFFHLFFPPIPDRYSKLVDLYPSNSYSRNTAPVQAEVTACA